MKKKKSTITDKINVVCHQMRLFPPTFEEILMNKLNEMETKLQRLEEKLDRQRKGQFAKIGANDKAFREMDERVKVIEYGLCHSNNENECEIIELVRM